MKRFYLFSPVMLTTAILTFGYTFKEPTIRLAPKRFLLANGLTVIAVEKHQLPLIEGLFAVKSGALADPKGKEGVASLVCSTLLKGTLTQTGDEIGKAIDGTGGNLRVKVDWDTTQISFHVHKKEMPTLLNLLADLIQHPSFPSNEIDREKKLSLERIRQMDNDNWRTADRWFFRALYQGDRMAFLPEGEEETISRIDRSDAEDFYRSHYTPQNSVLMLGGDLTEADLGPVQKSFGGWTGSRMTQRPGRSEVLRPSNKNLIWMVDKPDMSQAQIRIGKQGLDRRNSDYFAAEVLNALFGGGFSSRLMEELRRKRGLTYGVSSQFEYLRTGGTFSIWTFASNPKVGEIIQLTLEEMRKISQERLPEKEISAAKEYLLGVDAMLIESPADIENRLLELELNGLSVDSLFSQRDIIKKLAAEDIQQVAKRFLRPEGNVIVVLGRRSDIEAQLQSLAGELAFFPYNEKIKYGIIPRE